MLRGGIRGIFHGLDVLNGGAGSSHFCWGASRKADEAATGLTPFAHSPTLLLCGKVNKPHAVRVAVANSHKNLARPKLVQYRARL